MKLITAVFLLLFLSMALAVETCNYSGESDQQENSYLEDVAVYVEDLIADFDETDTSINNEERWLINLSNSLLQSHDININITALSHLNGYFDGQIDAETDFPVLDSKLKSSVLIKAIESQTASTSTLLTTMFMCEESDMQGMCDIDMLNQKLFIQDPDNLVIYFNELSQAVTTEDVEMIEVILQQMSQAKYSRNFSPITSEFSVAVEAYLQENPIKNFSKFEFAKELLDGDLEFDIQSMMIKHALSIYSMSTFFNIPSLRPLDVACEQFQKDPRHCQSIANTLIENSDTSLMTMMGYGLDVTLNETFGDAKSLAASQAADEAFGTYNWCVVQNHLLLVERMDLIDSEFSTILTQGEHEGTNLELAALYLYYKFKDSGREGVVDPRSCGLRYVGVKD